MANVRRIYDPFMDMADSFFNNTSAPMRLVRNSSFKVDIERDDQGYTVTAEAPGANKEDIDVEFEKGYLTLTVHKEEKSDYEREKYLHKERAEVDMSRQMYFGDDVDENNISAKLENGILNVRLPFLPEDVSKTKIQID